MTEVARRASLADGYLRCEKCGRRYVTEPHVPPETMRAKGWRVTGNGKGPILCEVCDYARRKKEDGNG